MLNKENFLKAIDLNILCYDHQAIDSITSRLISILKVVFYKNFNKSAKVLYIPENADLFDLCVEHENNGKNSSFIIKDMKYNNLDLIRLKELNYGEELYQYYFDNNGTLACDDKNIVVISDEEDFLLGSY